MPGQAWFKGIFRYLGALLFVVCAFGVRTSLDPLLGGTRFVYSVFYLTVVLAAYFCGPGPALVASAASALLAYWAFAPPAFALKINVEALTGMGFFTLTSLVDIYFINGMTVALAQYRREHQRAEVLAEGNASMFKEFSERTTHHLQLVAALLQSRAGDSVDALYRSALAEASLRTMAISRAHRALAEGGMAPVDFTAFARQLMGASLGAAGMSDKDIEISGVAISLPPERATSTAVILLEWVRAMLHHPRRERGAPIRLHIMTDERFHRLRLAAPLPDSEPGGGLMMDDVSSRIVEAAVDQIQGRCTQYRDLSNAVIELSLPIDPPAIADSAALISEPPSSLLH